MSGEPNTLSTALGGSSEGASPTWHRFVSPHYDDIALSCGGTVTLLAQSGFTPEIFVVFGDEPDAAVSLSPFARSLHEDWGLSAEAVIASRRREEASAAMIMGATSTNLPFLDAIYRGRHYESDAQLFGETVAAESHLPAWIASAMVLETTPDPSIRVYAPLGIGGHVDHRHGFSVGVALSRSGWDVWFYEDLPYALKAGAFDTRLAAIDASAPVEPAAVIDVSTTWETKLDAILAYPSQMATVFRYVGAGSSRAEIDARMRPDAERIGGGAPAERYWKLKAS